MERVAGIEPAINPSKTPEKTVVSSTSDIEVSRIGSRGLVFESLNKSSKVLEETDLSPAPSSESAQIIDAGCPLLAQVVESWPKLSPATREAIRTIAKEVSR